jgi:hypothetical protein
VPGRVDLIGTAGIVNTGILEDGKIRFTYDRKWDVRGDGKRGRASLGWTAGGGCPYVRRADSRGRLCMHGRLSLRSLGREVRGVKVDKRPLPYPGVFSPFGNQAPPDRVLHQVRDFIRQYLGRP